MKRKLEIIDDGKSVMFTSENIDRKFFPIIVGGIIKHVKKREDISDTEINMLLGLAKVFGRMSDDEFSKAWHTTSEMSDLIDDLQSTETGK